MGGRDSVEVEGVEFESGLICSRHSAREKERERICNIKSFMKHS